MRRDDPSTENLEVATELPAAADIIVAALRPLVTEQRYLRISEVARQRSHSLSVVLDRISDPHNISAVLRSADAFGIPRVHVIQERANFRAAPGVSKGTQRWVDLNVHDSVSACAKTLRANNFQIFVAAMNAPTAIDELPANQQIALVFGNEHRGPDVEWNEHAQGFFSIPMRGFVESLNVSVATAICLYALTRARDANRVANEHSAEQHQTLIARYLWHSVTNPEQALQRYVDANASQMAAQR